MSHEAGGGTPIVFVHGTRLTGAMWRSQLAALESMAVVAIDLPGHGRRADIAFTLPGASDAVAEAIDELGGAAIVVGQSLGGYVAMDLASRSPARVAGLVLAGATQEPVGLRSLPYRGLAQVLGVADERRLAALNEWYFRSHYPADIAGPIIADGFWSRGGADALRALVGERFLPRLAAYDGPTLVLNGSFDLLFRVGEPAFLAAARHPRRRVLGGASHLSNLDRPAAFTAAVQDFALEVAGGPAAAR
jgi:pimeloyl-ACP methyl ester carboxylesterase